MSFDIFLQRFADERARQASGAKLIEILGPYIEGTPTSGCVGIRTQDGGADCHGVDHPDDGIMLNHLTGTAIWDLLFDIAFKCSFAIMPVGCPTCVGAEGILRELPPELQPDARVVSSGKEILKNLQA